MVDVAVGNAAVATGVLREIGDDQVVLALPGTNYRMNLLADEKARTALASRLGKPITGRIRARARRVDLVSTGGRYVEPVYGRPRRLQGSIVGTDAAANSITVRCAPGGVFECELTADQKAVDFAAGQLVSFDVERGARFEPII